LVVGNIGTEEEVRKRGGDGYMQRAARRKEVLRGLLARNSPPRVKLPQEWVVGRDVVVVKSEVIAALAAAGVECG
jgi:hypothetical protein